ncbi:MAG: hypothetical protein GY769_16635 [bacterium]|nr:hypothetical protein [bacterium]
MRLPERAVRDRAIALVLALITLAGLLGLASVRDSFSRLSGDEPTYLHMAESLALDGDLEFGDADEARLEEEGRGSAGSAVILQTTQGRLTYSKPVVQPVLAAPFYRVAGKSGVVFLNLLAFAAAAFAAGGLLRAIDPERWLLTLTTFLCAGAVIPYTVWLTSDLLQFAVVLAGLSLCVARLRTHGRSKGSDTGWLILGGGLLGLAVAMRITNAPLAVAAVAAAASFKLYKQAGQILVAAALVLALGLGLNWALGGAVSPYLSERTSFSVEADEDSEALAGGGFGAALATVRLRAVRPQVSAYSALYFFSGRHTGLLLYFPTALVLLVLCGRRFDRVTVCLGLGIVAVVGAYLVFLPHNYFGGGSCIGNRYFLPVYGALLPALAALPRRRWLLAPWLVSLLVAGSALLSALQVPEAVQSSQGHAYAGVFRWFPYESTSDNLEGHLERYWRRPGVAPGDEDYRLSWDFVRFVDPFARVRSNSFVLETGAKPAELEVARRRSGGVMRFLVRSRARDLELRFEDWGKELAFPIRQPKTGATVIEIEPSRSWRKHQFWFFWELESDFVVQSFRLSIATPDGSPASAELHYLADGEIPEDMFASEVVSVALPSEAAAGSVSKVSLEARNASATTWTSDGVVPVVLGYRLSRLTDGRPIAFDGPRAPLTGSIRPGDSLSAELEIEWPAEPGRYLLTVDLVAEGVAWFSARTGAPLATAEVEVRRSRRRSPAACPERSRGPSPVIPRP